MTRKKWENHTVDQLGTHGRATHLAHPAGRPEMTPLEEFEKRMQEAAIG